MAVAPPRHDLGGADVEQWARLVWAGDVDVLSVGPLADTLRRVWQSEIVMLEIDLSEVTFIDCAGLRPLVGAHARLLDRMRLFAPSRPVTRLLDVLGLDRMFTVVGPLAPASGFQALPGPVMGANDRHTAEILSRLPHALDDRATIEQAKGILMGRHYCDAPSAWELLRGAARARDVQIRVMARMLAGGASARPSFTGPQGPGRPAPGLVPEPSDDGSELSGQQVADDVLAEFAQSGPGLPDG